MNYKEQLIDYVIKQNLLSGFVPTRELVEYQYDLLTKKYRLKENKSLLSSNVERIDPRSIVPLEYFREILALASIDCIKYKESYVDSYRRVFNLLDRWRMQTSAMDREIQLAEATIDGLLLTQSNSAGYLRFIKKDLYSSDNINSSENCNIALDKGIVTLGKTSSEYSRQLDISGAAIRANGSVNGVGGLSTLPGQSLNNLLDSSGNSWTAVISSATQGRAVCNIFLDIGRTVSINQVVIRQRLRSISRGTVSLWGSENRETYVKLGEVSLDEALAFSFEQTNLASLKIVIEKTNYDSYRLGTAFNYYFDLTSIEVYEKGVSDLITGEGNIEFKFNINSIDSAGDPIEKVALEVCEATSPSTSIDYYIKTRLEDRYSQIWPVNKEPNPSVPSVVNLGFYSFIDNNTADASVIVEGKSSTSLVLPNSEDFEEQLFLIDQPDSITDVAWINFNGKTDSVDSIEVYQDLVSTPSVNEIVGWNNFSTWLFVESPRTIDVGRYIVRINGVPSMGSIDLRQGWNYITIPRESYVFNRTSDPIANEEQLRLNDPLYPYNLKNIIEGVNYSSTYTGPRIYGNPTKRAAKILKRRTNYSSFLNQIDSSFYVVNNLTGSETSLDEFQILVKRPSDIADLEKKQYVVNYRQNRSLTEENSLYVKAVLTSRDLSISPILISFLAKMS
jgi:hypothetical protein